MRASSPSFYAAVQGARPLAHTLMHFGQDWRHAEAYALLYLIATRHQVTAALTRQYPGARIEFSESGSDLLIVLHMGAASVTQGLGQHALKTAQIEGKPSESFLAWMEAQSGEVDVAIASLQKCGPQKRAAEHLAAHMLEQVETLLWRSQERSLQA